MKTPNSGGVLVRSSVRDLANIFLTAILVHPQTHNLCCKLCAKRVLHIMRQVWVWVCMYPNPNLPNSEGLPVSSSARNFAKVLLRYISFSRQNLKASKAFCTKPSIYFFDAELLGLGSSVLKLNTCQTEKYSPYIIARRTMHTYSQDIYLSVLRSSRPEITCWQNHQFISLADLLGLGSNVSKPNTC